MLRDLISKLFERKGRFSVFAPIDTNKHEYQQPRPLLTESEQRLIFIDPHSTNKELQEKYGDALNN